jgi:hypothetical protein
MLFLISDKNVQVCDATNFNSSSERLVKKQFNN